MRASRRAAVLARLAAMDELAQPDLTDLIRRAQGGDSSSIDRLFEAVYPLLRRMARERLRRNSRNTLLDTTELVHESYLRFVGTGQLRLEDRARGPMTDPETEESGGELPEPNFVMLVSNFATQALIELGEVKNPITKQTERAPERAKFTIPM